MPESKTKADTDPKMAQNGPTWAQMAQDEPNMVPILAQQKPTDTYRNHKIPPKMAQRGPECPNIAHNAQHKPEIRQT